MIFIKDGVSISGIKAPMVTAIAITDSYFSSIHNVLTITSGTEGKHKKGSLHPDGLAIDIRSNSLSGITKAEVAAALQERLGAQFDVIAETDHIHIEFQPK